MPTTLHLAKHTHFVLDETELDDYTVTAEDIDGLHFLAHLTKHQHLRYDYQTYEIRHYVDTPALVISSGPSVLPVSSITLRSLCEV